MICFIVILINSTNSFGINKILGGEMNKVDIDIIKRLKKYDSATVQNAAIRVRGFIDEKEDYTNPELRCFNNGGSTVVGYAITAEVQPVNTPDSIIDWNEYYDELANSNFPVICILKDVDNPLGRGAVFGDGMAFRHVALGAVGVIVEGSIRDLPGIKKARCPVWAKGRVPGHGPFNLVSVAKNLEVSGLNISQGDLLVGDRDGITKVPLKYAEKISKVCDDVRKDESKMHKYFTSKDFNLEKYEFWKKNRR